MRIIAIFCLFLVSCTQSSNRANNGRGSASFNAATSAFSMKHFVDPETGNITEKLSIPKNYGGNIYLAIDNIDKLSDKHLYVRFRFGYLREYERVVPATISSAPSISPNMLQPVLIFSLYEKPFASVPLKFDLYDYNTYNFTSNVVSIEQNNRDKDLYCRGLRISDDPTATSSSCSGSGDKCLYAFAKLEDKGWLNQSTSENVNLSDPQIALDGQSDGSDLEKYALDSEAKFLGKCLSDKQVQSFHLPAGDPQEIAFGSNLNLAGIDYTYQGPFKAVNSFQWEIKSNAIWNSSYGLFQSYLGPVRNLDAGYQSLMFPRYSKLSIKPDVEYLGAQKAGDPEELLGTLDSDGKTFWMAGCNLRTSTKDYKSEHIGSCNISSEIEIFYMQDGDEAIVASSGWDDSSKQVKLQILQEGNLTDSTSILNPEYRTCSADSACASNECCFNGRCWSDSLVAQCGGEATSVKPDGASCVGTNGLPQDTACFSLCCRGPLNAGEAPGVVCRGHNPYNSDPIFCDKPVGQSCVTSAMCSRQSVTKERLIKGPSNDPGDCAVKTCKACVHRDCNVNTLTCQNIADTAATIDFDPDNPDCSTAVTEDPRWICDDEPGYNTTDPCDL